ncbi:hypothetical protein POJ06DRAFT_250635 [Lipomyces tetrasporus]|uniref:Secreted protein n=1 Tax=Lipomyces tetrasporus TaxID=54092 RepID=A0AAD7QTU0_9ASCO|nr:uncharacterized protein POJ06DRAFT_250635 [Lipomyces tetrasporus]KAJ8101163.1 hypothetical protein POJ06DRAFT_250635 [Lipomyces tetrasporus]
MTAVCLFARILFAILDLTRSSQKTSISPARGFFADELPAMVRLRFADSVRGNGCCGSQPGGQGWGKWRPGDDSRFETRVGARDRASRACNTSSVVSII